MWLKSKDKEKHPLSTEAGNQRKGNPTCDPSLRAVGPKVMSCTPMCGAGERDIHRSRGKRLGHRALVPNSVLGYPWPHCELWHHRIHFTFERDSDSQHLGHLMVSTYLATSLSLISSFCKTRFLAVTEKANTV